MSSKNLDKLPNAKVEKSYSSKDFKDAQEDTLEINNDILTPQQKRYVNETGLRENLAIAFTIIIAFWLIAVLCILVGNTATYQLSDSVLNTLLITTTANVIGMMTIILRNLFPKRDSL
tara:strand:- start:116 stop:469 length:354 start_codon:yes stop_codon:yes gene_type:complete